MLADEIAPPGVRAESPAAPLEGRVELVGDPGDLVTPVLEEIGARLEQLFSESGVHALEAGEQHDRVAARAGDGDRVELEVAEAADDLHRPGAGLLALAARGAGQVRPLGLQEARASEGEAAGGADVEGEHGRILDDPLGWSARGSDFSEECGHRSEGRGIWESSLVSRCTNLRPNPCCPTPRGCAPWRAS